MSPSKTHSKINILIELLHSIREWHHFYELTWLRSPWEPLGTPSLSDPPQMPPRYVSDASQMPLNTYFNEKENMFFVSHQMSGALFSFW